jgi:hypothetical protein
MSLVQNENTKQKDPHAQSARSFNRNKTVTSLFPPASDTITVQSTSHEYENARAFLK